MSKKSLSFIAASVLVFVLTLAAGTGLETPHLTGVRQINEDGFGTDANKYAFAMAVYDDALYVGALNIKSMAGMFNFLTGTSAKGKTEGAEIWRYGRDGTWTRVVDKGLTSPQNLGVRKMLAAGGCLYAVTANHDEGMEVWRTCDGDDWKAVVRHGFGDSLNTSGRGMGFFQGFIYVGTENRKKGAQLWRSPDGLDWERVAERGIDDPKNVWLSDFAEFKGCLYTGTLNITGGMQAYRTCDGVTFERLFSGGLRKKTNMAGMKLIVFKDRLFLSTMDFFRGFDLYVSSDGKNFEPVLERGFTSKHNAYLWQLQVYQGRLYAGTFNHWLPLPKGEFELYSTADGDNWEIENSGAFGNPWHYGVRSMAVFDGRLIIGSASARRGCKVFEAYAR